MEKREGAAVRSGDNLSGYNLPGNCDNLPCIGGLNQFTNTKSPNLTTEFPSLTLCTIMLGLMEQKPVRTAARREKRTRNRAASVGL